MAVKRKSSKKTIKRRTSQKYEVPADESILDPQVKEESELTKPAKKEDKWQVVGWTLLLVGGLAHMLPTQMAPLLSWSIVGISLQMIVGVLSVVMALYFLLGE